jgi:hypothetical protein
MYQAGENQRGPELVVAVDVAVDASGDHQSEKSDAADADVDPGDAVRRRARGPLLGPAIGRRSADGGDGASARGDRDENRCETTAHVDMVATRWPRAEGGGREVSQLVTAIEKRTPEKYWLLQIEITKRSLVNFVSSDESAGPAA